MERTEEHRVVKCGSCLRLLRDKNTTTASSIPDGDGGHLTSTESATSIQQCLASESRMTMQSVNKQFAAAMSMKLQTLPRIQENQCPQSFPAASAMMGCTLEESAMSFNSISSYPSNRFDVSWKSFLKKFQPEAFEQGNNNSRSSVRSLDQDAVGEITPAAEFENEIMQQTSSDATVSVEEVTFQDMERDVNDTVMTMIGRKHAGQKKEKPKGGRMSSYSRKTVPVVVKGEDQDSPLGRSSAPFNFTILPSNVDVPIDEVSTRDRGLPLLPEERKKLEARYVDYDSSSCGSSFKSRRRWLSHGGSSSIRRKKGSVKSLDAISQATRLDYVPKVAGVCDGSRSRRSKGELWIRA